MYDIVIIGSGPAGLTAALYARRAGKSVLVLEKEAFGGQITHSPKVENYPGTMQMSGNEFAERLLEQALALGAEIDMDAVTEIRRDGDKRIVVGENKSYEARAVIIASGSKHRQLGLENENELVGNGVSYCAVCDGAFYKDKTVIVVGGGNSAMQEAVLLSETSRKVIMVQNLDFLTGEEKLAEILKSKDNVEIMYGRTVAGLVGKEALMGVEVSDAGGKTELLEADGVFVAIGQQPENEAFASVCELDGNGYIVSDERCLTRDPAVFAAGDCRTKTVRQITTATGDGATAAVAACKYLDNM